MNKKTKTIFWILFVLLIINLSALITIFFEVNKIKNFEENRDYFRNNNRCNFKEQLNFTPAQREKHQALKTKHITAVKEYTEEMKAKKQAIVDEFRKKPTNDSLLMANAKEIGELYAQMQMLDITHMREVLQICDKEQEALFLEEVIPSFFMRDMPRKHCKPQERGRPHANHPKF